MYIISASAQPGIVHQGAEGPQGAAQAPVGIHGERVLRLVVRDRDDRLLGVDVRDEALPHLFVGGGR